MASLRDLIGVNTDSGLAAQLQDQDRAAGMGSLARGWTSGRIGNDINRLRSEEAGVRSDGDIAGGDSLRDQVEVLKARQALYAPEVGKVEDIDWSPGRAASWLGGAVGQGVASSVDQMATGAAINGVATVAGLIPHPLAQAASRGLRYAAPLAMYAQNVPLAKGENYDAMTQSPTIMASHTPQELNAMARNSGMASALLDTALPAYLAHGLGGGGLKQGLRGMGTLGHAGLGMAGEGATETAQELIKQGALTQLDAGRDKSGDNYDLLNSFAGGMAGSGPMSLASSMADAGYRRVGNTAERLVEGVHDLAQSGMDLAGQARDAATPLVGQVREKGGALFGRAKQEAVDLASGGDGKVSADALLTNLRDAAEGLRPASPLKHTEDELRILTGTPPEEIVDDDDATMDWLDANDAALPQLVTNKLQALGENPEAQTLMSRLVEAGDNVEAQDKASKDAAKWLLANTLEGRTTERASKLGQAAGVFGNLVASAGKAAGKVAMGAGRAMLDGAKEGMSKKNMQADGQQDEDFVSWRDKVYGANGRQVADQALAEGASYKRAQDFNQRAELAGSYAADMANRMYPKDRSMSALMRRTAYTLADMAESWDTTESPDKNHSLEGTNGGATEERAPVELLRPGAREVKLNRIVADLKNGFGKEAPTVLESIGSIMGTRANAAVEYMREELNQQMSPRGAERAKQLRAQLANDVVSMVGVPEKLTLLKQGVNLHDAKQAEHVLGLMEDYADGIGTEKGNAHRRGLDALLGKESVDSILAHLNGLPEKDRPGPTVDDRGAVETAELDGPVLSDELDGPAPNDYERASAEKKVTKGAGRKLYGMHSTANMRVDDPFAPTNKLSPKEVSELELAGQSAMTRPKLFGKDTKVYIETKDIDAWNEAHPKEKAELVTLNRPNGKTEQKGHVPGMTKKVADMEAELGIARTPERMAELMEAEGNTTAAQAVRRRVEAAKPNSGATTAQRAKARADLKEAAEVFFLNRAGGHRVEAKSVRDVMKDMNMQPAKVLQLFRDYAGQESRESMGADGTGAGMLDAAADARYVIAEQVRADKENAIRERNKKRVKQGLAPEPLPTFTPYNAPELRAASARFRDKFNRANAEGRFASLERKYGKVDTTKVEENKEFMRAARARFLEEQREILMGKAEAYFADKYMAVGEQLSDQDPEKMPATDLTLLAKDGVGMLERTRGRTRNGVFEEFPDDVRQQKLIDANLIEFKDRAGKPMMIPAGKLVNWVRQQRGYEETKDYSNRAKDEAYLDDVMTGVSTIMASGFVADGAWPTMVNKEGKAESFAKGIPSSLRLATMTMGAREAGTALKRDKRGPVSDELFQGPDQEEVAADQMRQADFFTPEDRTERDMVVDAKPTKPRGKMREMRASDAGTELVTREAGRGTSTRMRVDVSGTIAAEPKTENGDATEMDFFPKKKDGQVPGDFDDQQWLTQQTNQRFEGGPEPKGTAASRAEFRAGKITEAFLADPAKGQEMIRMRLRMAAAPGYNDGSTARKTPLLDKDGNQYQSKKGPVFDTAKAEVVGGPHYIAPLAAFISTKNLVDNNVDMGAKAIAAIRQRVAGTLLGAKMENAESLKIARLMLDDPKTVTAMNYKGKLQQLVDGAPAMQAAPVTVRVEPVSARVEPVAKPAAPAAPAAPKPKATTMQDLVDERIDYLRNPPKDYTPEKAQFYVDWAKKQVERIETAIKASWEPGTQAETDETYRLYDLRSDLRDMVKAGEEVLRNQAEMAATPAFAADMKEAGGGKPARRMTGAEGMQAAKALEDGLLNIDGMRDIIARTDMSEADAKQVNDVLDSLQQIVDGDFNAGGIPQRTVDSWSAKFAGGVPVKVVRIPKNHAFANIMAAGNGGDLSRLGGTYAKIGGKHIIASYESGNKEKASSLSRLAHEFGHALQAIAFDNASRDIKIKLIEAHARDVAELGKDKPDFTKFISAGRLYDDDVAGVLQGKPSEFAPGARKVYERAFSAITAASKDKVDYITSFDEWFAENFSKYVTSDVGANLDPEVKGFWAKLYSTLKDFFKNYVAQYTPDADFKGWVDSLAGRAPAQEVAAGLGKPLGGVKLTGTGVYVTKDNTKSTQATKFIGRGSARSSTAEYARQWGDKANTGNYTSADRVFVSAEGNRTGRLSPDAAEIGRATSAGATILTDGPADRAREYNAGERQVAEILTSKGYSESAPGVWNPARKLNAMADAIHTDQGRSDFAATRTSAFAAWFGDSKVVNADGTPMVVYHGTRLDFPAFNNKDQHNKGFYFSPVPQIANQYAKDMVDGTDGGNVKPVYLSLRNPKIIEAPTKEQALANAAKGLPAFDRMQTAFVDEDDMAEYIAQGYDGLWNKAMQEIIAFHPEQIKSAVGNNGEYNPKNPDITKNAQENGGYVNNAMPPVNPRATTDAEMAAARTYATKTLGPKIKVMFREITGYSGEFIDATNTIEISTTAAAGTMGTLYHEAMHVFFRDFVKSNPKLQSVFSALVDDPKHLARLHALLDGYPAAQAQLSSGEERLAYTYQFWKAGLIQVDAKAQTWMQKVGKFFRRVLGQVRDSEHALALFEAFDQGKLAEPSVAGHVIAKQLSQGAMGIKARRQLDGLIQGLAALTMPAASVLGTSASPTARRLGKMFFTNPGEGADGRMETGLLNARRNVSQQYTNAANRLFAEMNDVDQREVQRHLQAETPLDKIADAAHQQYVQKIRGMLANFHTYMVDAGMTIGKVENNYYPTVWNAEALLGQQAEFITMLETKYADEISQAGTDPAVAARRIWQSLVSKEGVDAHLPAQREDGVLNPFFASQERRTLPFIKGEDKERFLEKNMPMTLTRYFKQGAHAAEYFRRFGKDGHKLEKSLARISDELRTASQEMVKSGVLKDEDARAKWHSRQMRDISQSVGAMEGSLGKDVSPSMRKFNSWMTVYQNVRLLPMSLFSSMVDPLALVARGAPMQAAYESFMYGMREVFRTWGDAFRDMPAKRAADEWRDLAELIGASEVAQFSHHVSEEYASTYLTHGAKKINDKMFVINGMEAWNRGSRIMATKWGVRFLEKHAALPDPHHSKRWLSELGLTPSMLTLDDGKLVTNRDQLAALKGVSAERADQLLAPIYAALNRWVEGAVLTPGAALRPAWSSDPNWASMFHLKQFSYAFHQVILKRATNEFKHGNMAPIGALAAFIPTMITADIMKGLLQGGGELPPFMKSWDAGDWFMHGVNRAGLTGIGQVGMDAAIDPASLGGPAFEQAMDALRDPAGVSLLNAAPLHSLYAQAVN